MRLYRKRNSNNTYKKKNSVYLSYNVTNTRFSTIYRYYHIHCFADINEVKKDVLELDNKIRSLEDFINSELLSLQKSEEEIIRQVFEIFFK